MGDIGDYWKEHREHKRRFKPEGDRRRTETARRVFKKLGVIWQELNEHHWQIFHVNKKGQDLVIQFWPTTSAWHWPGQKQTRIGLNPLLSHMGFPHKRRS